MLMSCNKCGIVVDSRHVARSGPCPQCGYEDPLTASVAQKSGPRAFSEVRE